ncbi:DNA helicase II, partial [Pseudomonas frederiksbergensis]|nr:DNA helicase II [Pseudomonas frederiksbergensis]
HARHAQVSMWESMSLLIANKALKGRAASALGAFMEMIENLAAKVMEMPLHLMTQTVIEQSGLIVYHQEEKGEKGQA